MLWRAGVTSVLLTVGLALGLGEACGSTALAPADASTPTVEQCLTSINDNGAKCDAPPTLLCYAAIPCQPTPQQANCFCTNGKWQCSYDALDGGIIPPDTDATCFNEISAPPGVCPAREPVGVVACGQPGLQCSYPGLLCPESDSGKPNVDTCQCSPGTTLSTADGALVTGEEGGLTWECDRDLCNPTSDATTPPPPDTGPPDTGPPEGSTGGDGGDKDAKGGKDAKSRG
jgi:hypothetical protein